MRSEWRSGVRYVGIVIVPLVLLFAGPGAAHAQMQDPSEASGERQTTLNYGMRLGVAVTDVAGEAVAGTDRGAHPLIGAFLSYPATNRLLVQPEVAYRVHGVEVASAEQQPPQPWRYTTHYLEAPVLLKGYLPSPEDTRFYLQAGPKAAVKLSQTADLAPSQTDDLPPAFGDSFRSTNLGVVFGSGVDRYVEGWLISIDVRYEVGLTNLVAESDLPSLYSRSLDFTIGIGL